MSTNQTFLIFVIAIILLTSVIGIVGRYMSRQRLLKSMVMANDFSIRSFYQTELTFRL